MRQRFLLCAALMMLVLFSVVSTGCTTTLFGPAPQYHQQPAATPAFAVQTTSPAISDLALTLSDFPGDYLLRDRSVVAYEQVGPVFRELSWQQGYEVSFYRMNRAKGDNTLVRQLISIFPADRVDTVYEVEKESMLAQPDGTMRYEVPFPTTGDESIAFRENDLNAPERNVTYSLLFAKNNVYETITMGGTTTDYETLKDLALKAAGRIP
ncbi:MAG: hypothetical protein ABSB80_12295 [Methanoregula sp.]|uniref:hypothetical protein n=1 Tax=Methanoregula sp. TaxID=2052170 RepID=UPI003D0D1DEE